MVVCAQFLALPFKSCPVSGFGTAGLIMLLRESTRRVSVGGSIVVLFKWCSIVIALYIMRTFSPNSGSVFCGLLVCFVLSCCVCCLQLNESSCSCLNCLVVCWLYLTNCL